MIVSEGGHEEPIWEAGIDRVADLAILPANEQNKVWDTSIKSVQLADDW